MVSRLEKSASATAGSASSIWSTAGTNTGCVTVAVLDRGEDRVEIDLSQQHAVRAVDQVMMPPSPLRRW